MTRMKITTYTVRASRNQRARWWYWAKRAGYRALGKWLESLADAETRRREIEGGYIRPPPDSDS